MGSAISSPSGVWVGERVAYIQFVPRAGSCIMHARVAGWQPRDWLVYARAGVYLTCASLYCTFRPISPTAAIAQLQGAPALWHRSCVRIGQSGQKCGNTALKTVKISNFGQKFVLQGRLVCNIFFTKFSAFVRLYRYLLSF